MNTTNTTTATMTRIINTSNITSDNCVFNSADAVAKEKKKWLHHLKISWKYKYSNRKLRKLLMRMSLTRTHRHEELNDAVQHFNVVILQPAAPHCGQLQVLLLLPLGSREVVAAAPRPVGLPPWLVWRHSKGENGTFLQEHSQ